MLTHFNKIEKQQTVNVWGKQPLAKPLQGFACSLLRKLRVWSFPKENSKLNPARDLAPFKVKGGDPAALSSTATLLRLHPPH